MQRKRELKIRQQLEREREEEVEQNRWVLKNGDNDSSLIIADADDDNRHEYEKESTKFVPGRRSFGNFNPQVEKLVKEVKRQIDHGDETISDEEMARRMKKYTGLPGKGRPGKKPKKGGKVSAKGKGKGSRKGKTSMKGGKKRSSPYTPSPSPSKKQKTFLKPKQTL